MDPTATEKRAPLFGPLPTRGIWTAVELTRTQFLSMLTLSAVLFLFIGGPLWAHARESHFWRINLILILSYAIIPFAVAAAFFRNRKTRLVPIIVASGVVALIKLVVTAVLLVLIGVAQA